MKKLSVLILLMFVFAWTSAGSQTISTAPKSIRTLSKPTYALMNGLWFNGRVFERKTFYSVNGFLSSKKPNKVDAEINLNNKFVVPPFAEAHNHNLGGARGLESQIAMYLKDGVFYCKNLHYVRELTAPIFDRVNLPSSVDVSYAHAGLTASGGHAVELYEMLLQRGVFPGWKKEDLDTKTFFIIDDENDLEKNGIRCWLGSRISSRPILSIPKNMRNGKATQTIMGTGD